MGEADAQVRRQAVEAVVAAHFLDEIDFPHEIDAERGRGDRPAAGRRGDRQAKRS
ncbi:hypothetical protein D3C83_274780 [compost metagenome]